MVSILVLEGWAGASNLPLKANLPSLTNTHTQNASQMLIFPFSSRGHATLQEALSIGPLVHWSVHHTQDENAKNVQFLLCVCVGVCVCVRN